MIVTTIFFYLFSAVAIASAVMVIGARNPVHSVLFLILAFVNAAGLFVLLGAEFLAMILIVVYVGAVAVLFLFVVMMLDVDFVELRQGFLNYLPVGALIGVVLLAELLIVLGGWVFAPDATVAPPAPGRRRVQHRGARADPLHALRLLLPGGGHGPARRHDRRDRAHAPPPRRTSSASRSPRRSRGRRRPRSRSARSSRGRGI